MCYMQFGPIPRWIADSVTNQPDFLSSIFEHVQRKGLSLSDSTFRICVASTAPELVWAVLVGTVAGFTQKCLQALTLIESNAVLSHGAARPAHEAVIGLQVHRDSAAREMRGCFTTEI